MYQSMLSNQYYNPYAPRVNYMSDPYQNTAAMPALLPTAVIPPTPVHQNTASDTLSALHMQGIQNMVNINQAQVQTNANLSTGQQIINEFKQKYPTLESSSMLDVKVMQLKQSNATQDAINLTKKLADNATDKYVSMLENTPLSSNFSDSEFVKQIEENINKYNIANCSERAFLIADKLNQSGIKNKIVEISGTNPSSNHVFNVIGLAANADITKPETWGENAVIIDTWADKTCSANEMITFYKEFLGYNAENQPMSFQEDTIEESRMSTLEGAQKLYEKKTNTPITFLQLGSLTFSQINRLQTNATQPAGL